MGQRVEGNDTLGKRSGDVCKKGFPIGGVMVARTHTTRKNEEMEEQREKLKGGWRTIIGLTGGACEPGEPGSVSERGCRSCDKGLRGRSEVSAGPGPGACELDAALNALARGTAVEALVCSADACERLDVVAVKLARGVCGREDRRVLHAYAANCEEIAVADGDQRVAKGAGHVAVDV